MPARSRPGRPSTGSVSGRGRTPAGRTPCRTTSSTARTAVPSGSRAASGPTRAATRSAPTPAHPPRRRPCPPGWPPDGRATNRPSADRARRRAGSRRGGRGRPAGRPRRGRPRPRVNIRSPCSGNVSQSPASISPSTSTASSLQTVATHGVDLVIDRTTPKRRRQLSPQRCRRRSSPWRAWSSSRRKSRMRGFQSWSVDISSSNPSTSDPRPSSAALCGSPAKPGIQDRPDELLRRTAGSARAGNKRRHEQATSSTPSLNESRGRRTAENAKAWSAVLASGIQLGEPGGRGHARGLLR